MMTTLHLSPHGIVRDADPGDPDRGLNQEGKAERRSAWIEGRGRIISADLSDAPVQELQEAV